MTNDMTEFSAPEERQLIAALELLETKDELPDIAEVEPGALLQLVKIAWRKAGRDGRRKHLTDADVAALISSISGEKFSRNLYQAMFGEGRRLGKINNYQQGIKAPVAKGFLKVALTNWRKADDQANNFTPLFVREGFDLDRAIENACIAMFGENSTKRLEVYCRGEPGPSIRRFYGEHGEAFGHSVVVTSRHEPIIMNKPETQILEWMQLMETLLLTKPAQASNTIHVWAMEEPAVSREPEDMLALTNMGRLQNVLMIARSVCAAENLTDLWDAINGRCPIAILRKWPVAESPTFIDQHAIFPSEVPAGWQARGVGREEKEITSLVTVSALSGRVTYSSFVPTPRYPIPPVIELSSPGEGADRAFRNLHLACLGFLRLDKHGDTDEVSAAEAVQKATAEGWAFIHPEKFIGQHFPLT